MTAASVMVTPFAPGASDALLPSRSSAAFVIALPSRSMRAVITISAGAGTPAIIAEEENGLLQLKGYVLGGKSSAQHTPVDLAACGVDLTGATATKIGTTTRMTFGLKYSGEAGGAAGPPPPPGGGGGIGGSPPPPPPIGGGGGVGGGTCGTASSDLTIPREISDGRATADDFAWVGRTYGRASRIFVTSGTSKQQFDAIKQQLPQLQMLHLRFPSRHKGEVAQAYC